MKLQLLKNLVKPIAVSIVLALIFITYIVFIGSPKTKAAGYYNLAIQQQQLGDYTKANEYYFNSLKTAEEISDTNRIATALNNIGAVYQNKDKTQDKALEFYLRALPFGEKLYESTDLVKKAFGPRLLGTTTVGIGEIYLRRFERDTSLSNRSFYLDTALIFFNRSLEVYKGTVDEPYTLNNIGKVYVNRKQYDKAIQDLRESIAKGSGSVFAGSWTSSR